jgi:hypothetical protein
LTQEAVADENACTLLTAIAMLTTRSFLSLKNFRATTMNVAAKLIVGRYRRFSDLAGIYFAVWRRGKCRPWTTLLLDAESHTVL